MVKQKTDARAGQAVRFALLLLLNLLIVAVAVRPLHLHEFGSTASDGQHHIAEERAFCFECTYGTEQVVFTHVLAICTESQATILPALAHERPLAALLRIAGSRAPPRG